MPEVVYNGHVFYFQMKRFKVWMGLMVFLASDMTYEKMSVFYHGSRMEMAMLWFGGYSLNVMFWH